MKLKFATVLALLGLLFGLFASTAQVFAAGTFLSTDPIYKNIGDTFNVSIKINTDQQIIGWQMDVSFDPAVVKLNGWTEDPSWLKAAALAAGGDTFRMAGTINNTTGSLTNASVAGLGFPADQGVSGPGGLADLSFTALANGKSQLSFLNVCLVLPNSTCLDGVVLSPSFIRVGPLPFRILMPIIVR